MSHFYAKAGMVIAMCGAVSYFAAGRGKAIAQRGEPYPQDEVPQDERSVSAVNRQRGPGLPQKLEKDEVPADVAALRRALLAQAMSSPVPSTAEAPMERARAVLEERKSSAPS